MIYSTATVPVNPDGVIPLSRAQVWQGLVLKARDARLFLPPGYCTKCDVTVEGDGFIVREATILNDDLVEGITFEPFDFIVPPAFEPPTDLTFREGRKDGQL